MDNTYQERNKDLDDKVMEVLRIMAEQNNISKDEVIGRLQRKIDWGMYNTDAEIQKKWQMIPRVGDILMPYDYVVYLLTTCPGQQYRECLYL